MTSEDLQDIILCGETTTVQFKQNFTTQKKIADEMVAFANSRGGMIIFGVEDKTGNLYGLTYDELQTISRELGNTANEQIRPTIYIETEVVKIEEKHFLVCHVKEGNNKPYKNLTINPGSLAGGLTIEEIKLGNSFARNPLLANFCSKTMTYRGLGFGVPRSLKEDVRVEFENDASGNQFTARIWRIEKNVVTNTKGDKHDVAKDTIDKLTERQKNIYNRIVETGKVEIIKDNGSVATNVVINVVRNYIENARTLSVYLDVNERTVQRDLAAMQAQGIISHNGPTKAGYWEIKLSHR